MHIDDFAVEKGTETIGVGFAELDAQSLAIVRSNRAWRAEFATDRGPLEPHVDTADRATLIADLHALGVGNRSVVSTDVRMMACDGRSVSMRLWAVRIEADTIPLARLALFVAAPESKPRAKKWFQRKGAPDQPVPGNREFRAFFELRDTGKAMADPTTGRFVGVNARMCEITGYSADELLQRTYHDITHPDDRGRSAEMVGQSVDGERSEWRIEKRYIRKNGEVIWVCVTGTVVRHPDGRPAHTVAVISDITDRRRASEALRATEMRVRHVMDSVRVLISYIDANERYQFVNAEYERWFALPHDAIENRTLREVVGDAAYAIIEPYVRRVLQGEEVQFEADVPYRTAGRRVVEVRYLPHRADDGRVLGFYAVLSDIAVRKQAQEHLQRMNEWLERRVAERTAEAEARAVQLRRLALELTHAEHRERRRLAETLHDHLQQLVVAAKLQAITLPRHAATPDIKPRTQRIVELLDQTIEVSRNLTAELRPPVLYEEGLAPALRWLGDWMTQTHGLVVAVEAEGRADGIADDIKALLFQAVRELLFNIVKHAGMSFASIHCSYSADGEVRIVVSDEGTGFDPAGVSRGSGFGLFSVRERLRSLGGDCEIESAPGSGTTVTLSVPAQVLNEDRAQVLETVARQLRAERDSASPMLAPMREHGSSAVRVLLVDDHKIVREGVATLLSAMPDIEIVGEAANGREAVDLAHALRPDVVVMDVNMPVMNGIDATREIKEQLPQITVIGLSVHDDETTAASMKSAGAAEMLAKGGDSDSLVDAVRRLVRATA